MYVEGRAENDLMDCTKTKNKGNRGDKITYNNLEEWGVDMAVGGSSAHEVEAGRGT